MQALLVEKGITKHNACLIIRATGIKDTVSLAVHDH